MTYMQNDQHACFEQHWAAAGFCLMSFVQCVAGMILATLCLGGLSCQIDLFKVQNLHLGSSNRGPLNKDSQAIFMVKRVLDRLLPELSGCAMMMK